MAGCKEKWLSLPDVLGRINRAWVVQCQQERGVCTASVLGDSAEGDAGHKDGKTACIDLRVTPKEIMS